MKFVINEFQILHRFLSSLAGQILYWFWEVPVFYFFEILDKKVLIILIINNLFIHVDILENRTCFFIVSAPLVLLSEFLQEDVVLDLCNLGSHILWQRVELLLQLQLPLVHAYSSSWSSIFKFYDFSFFFFGRFLFQSPFIFIFGLKFQQQIVSGVEKSQMLWFCSKKRKSPRSQFCIFCWKFVDFYHRNAFFLDSGFDIIINEWRLIWEILQVFFLRIRHFWKIKVLAAYRQPWITYEIGSFLQFALCRFHIWIWIFRLRTCILLLSDCSLFFVEDFPTYCPLAPASIELVQVIVVLLDQLLFIFELLLYLWTIIFDFCPRTTAITGHRYIEPIFPCIFPDIGEICISYLIQIDGFFSSFHY